MKDEKLMVDVERSKVRAMLAIPGDVRDRLKILSAMSGVSMIVMVDKLVAAHYATITKTNVKEVL